MNDRIEKRIELHAPLSRVWRALTDYREFGEWFRVKLEGPFVPGKTLRGRVTHPGDSDGQGHASCDHRERVRPDSSEPSFGSAANECHGLGSADGEHREACLA